MQSAIFAIALLSGTAALALTDATQPPADAWPTPAAATPAPAMTATGSTVAPGNATPARDARGIPVISNPATVPPGFNGMPDAAGTGGPLEEAADNTRPCTRTVTDNCVQTHERGRQR